MDFQDLYYFIKIAELGSLSRAAERLDIPASTLSRRMAALEKKLGYQLMRRTARSFGLTVAGSKYYERLKKPFAEIEFESLNIKSELDGLSGDITISAPLALGRQVVSQWVFEFMKANPNVSVELLLSNQPIDLIKKGVDIALRVGEIGMNDWIGRTLGPIRYSMVASTSFLEKQGAPNSLAELEQINTITISTSPLWRLEGPDGTTTIHPRRNFRCDVITACLEAVMNDMGVALLPHFLVDKHIKSGALAKVLPEWQPQPKMLRMYYSNREHIPSNNRAFIEFILEKSQELADY